MGKKFQSVVASTYTLANAAVADNNRRLVECFIDGFGLDGYRYFAAVAAPHVNLAVLNLSLRKLPLWVGGSYVDSSRSFLPLNL